MFSSSHLQIFSSSHPHTFSVANPHVPKSSNLDIYIVKSSNIFTSRSSEHFFFTLQISPPLNLRSSQFHTLSSAASRQKNKPTGTTFSSVAFGQKHNHRSRKCCPNRFNVYGPKGKGKTCPSAALIQKQTRRRKNIFSSAGKNWSEWN